MKPVLCLPVFLFAAIACYSQLKVTSFQQVLQDVVANYPSIKAKAALVKAAAYSTAAVRKDYLPDLVIGDEYQYSTSNGLVGSYYSNGETAISTSGGVHASNNYQGTFGSFTTLMVNWHAFDFGKVRQNVAFAKAQEQLYNDDYVNEIFQQQVKAADIYLLLSLTEKLVSVQQENLQRALTFYQFVNARALNGLVAGVDTSYANAQVANAQLSLLQSKEHVEQQKVQLAALAGISADQVEADTTVFLQSVPVGGFVDFATIANNPAISFAKQQVAVQQENSLVIKKSPLPTVNILGMGWARGSGISDVTGDYSSKISDGIPYQTYNYMAALALRWNITSLAKTKEQYKAQQQVVLSSQSDLNEEVIKLQNELQSAKLQYQYALQQTKLAPIQYQSALQAYTQSNARYQAGLATLPELIDALYGLNQAEVNVAVANNNVWRALLQQAAATGDLPTFLQQLPR